MKRSAGIAIPVRPGRDRMGPGDQGDHPLVRPGWNIGDAQDIRWTSTGVTQPNVKIMLWQGNLHPGHRGQYAQ